MVDVGALAQRLCLVDDDVLAMASDVAAREGRRIGDALVFIGAITREQLDEILALQTRLRAHAGNVRAAEELVDRSRAALLTRMRRLSER
jgi:hypothetical protein